MHELMHGFVLPYKTVLTLQPLANLAATIEAILLLQPFTQGILRPWGKMMALPLACGMLSSGCSAKLRTVSRQRCLGRKSLKGWLLIATDAQ